MPKFLEVTNKTAARAAIEAAYSATALQYVTAGDKTGVADSRAALQAVLDAAQPGDTIYLPGGTFKISSELVIDKPLVLRGGGGMFRAQNQGGTFPGSAGTNIITTSATANGIRISSGGVVIEDLAVVNTRSENSPPTGGTGIFMNYANNFRLSRVTVAGFYDCVRVEGRFGNMDSCNIFDPVRYGIYLYNDNAGEYDFGDQGINNCNIAMYGRQADAEAAVRFESGGGIRFTGNKIVAGTGPGVVGYAIGDFKYGIDAMLAPSATTVEFMISGGAISTCTEACIRFGQQELGTAGFGDITVTGVVLQGKSNKGIIVGAISPVNANNIKSVNITGNTFKGTQAGGIIAYNMKALVIGPNCWSHGDEYTAPLITLAGSSTAGTDDGTGTLGVDVQRQVIVNNNTTQNITLVHDKRTRSSAHSLDGKIEYNYKRGVYTNTTGWKTMYTIEPSQEGSAGIVEATLTGNDFGVGYFAKKIRRGFRRPNTATGVNTVTLTTLGTDESIGDATSYVGLQIVDGGAGKILVQVAMLEGGATVWGDLEVNVQGQVQKFSLGTGS